MALESYTPAKKNIGYIALAVSVLLVAAFAFILRSSMRSPRTVNPADYSIETPAGFRHAYSQIVEGGALSLRGWACIEGERILTVDNWVVLYNTDTNSYLRIPTIFEANEEADEVIGGEILYSRAGFTCVVPLKYLDAAPECYEVCFAYRSNGHNLLVHTGEMLAGGAV